MNQSTLWVVALSVSAVANACFWPAILAFVRIGDMRVPYLVAVVLFTSIGAALTHKFVVGHAIRAVAVGSLVGFLASIIALQFAKLFDRPGIAFHGVGEFSAFSMFAVDAFVALLLGGWFAGVLSALAVSRLKV